jgi:acetamidase/formamidase
VQTLHHRDGHHGWDAQRPPVVTIAPGDEVELHCQDASDGQLHPDSTAADVASLDLDRANPLTGPVLVDGAAPGDALVVDVLDVAGADWGWTALIPGFGLLSVGDGHAVQGDGEVCGTAVETPTTTRLRLSVERGAAPPAPRLAAPAPPTHAPGRVVTTTGVGPDLRAGARDAVRAMVEVLGTHGVDPADAYLLCSLAGNLRIGEVVNAPTWLVACTFPLDVLS